MKRTVLVLLVLMTALSSATTSELLVQAGTSTDIVSELFTSWQAISVMAIMVSALLVALTYMLGIGFEIPSLKAFAGTELGQVIASIIIILTMWILMGIIDAQVALLINGQIEGMTPCAAVGQSCLKDAATFYLNGYIDSAKAATRALLINNMEATDKGSGRNFFSCYSAVLPIPCMQLSLSDSEDAFLVLDMDTNQVLYEYYASLLSSMEAQKMFVESVCFKIAPFILAVGIVARTFFVTRKLGGLLIACAAALLFVLPLMYIFDWMTLNLEFTSDKAFGDQANLCPLECQLTPALVYDSKTNFSAYTQADLYSIFYDGLKDPTIARNLSHGKLASYDWKTNPYDATKQPSVRDPDPNLISCENASYIAIDSLGGDYVGNCVATINNSLVYAPCGSPALYDVKDVGGVATPTYEGSPIVNCPFECRELPYPYTNPICVPPVVQQACSKLSEVCKVNRMANANTLSTYADEELSCPEECKVVPPLKSDCSAGNCLESRFDCRVSVKNDTSFRFTPIGYDPNCALDSPGIDKTSDSYKLCVEYHRCAAAFGCPVSLNGSESCTYVLPPDPQSCQDLCPTCPDECRVIPQDPADPQQKLPTDCYQNGQSGALIPDCQESSCPDSCKIPIQRMIRLDKDYQACKTTVGTDEHQCTYACRVAGLVDIPAGCDKIACDLKVCSGAFKEVVPSSSCQKCLDIDTNFQYTPAILRDCADYCAKAKSPTESKTSPLTMNDFVGGPDYQNIAQLLLQAYLLPLFDFAVTLMFIRSFSGMLGGDIEIPGVARLL